jgi:hypothetical protein
MKDLIAKLEAAKEGSRELDVAIVYALHPDIGPYRPHCAGEEPRFWQDPFYKQPCPKFTTSLDAALSLVPADPANKGKAMLWSVTHDEDGVGGPRGYIAAIGKGYHDPQFIYGHHDTNPALALCIAALRARSAT